MSRNEDKGGRPPLPPGERRDARIQVRLTDAEHEEVRQAARERRTSIAEWCREALLAAARRIGGRRGR